MPTAANTPLSPPTPTWTLVPLEAPVTLTSPPTPAPTTTLTPTYDAGRAAEILVAGNRNFEAGNIPGAINDYSLAILEDRQYAEAYYRRGLAYVALGDTESALVDFNQAIELDPYQPNAYIARAKLLLEAGSIEAALNDLKTAEGLNPRIGELYLVRGEAYAAQNDFERALVSLDFATVLMPNQPEPYIKRGRVHLSMGDPGQALIDLNVALALAPGDADALFARGQIHAADGEYDTALADFVSARQAGLDSTDLLIDTGKAYIRLNQPAAALEVLEEAVARESENLTARYWYGLAAFGAENYSLAVEEAAFILAYEPQNIQALTLKATANLYRGRWADASEGFQQAYAIDPAYVDGLIGIAQAQVGMGQYEGAALTLEHYLLEAPPDAAMRPTVEAVLAVLRSTPEPGSQAENIPFFWNLQP